MLRVKRLPLKYPDIPTEANPDTFKSTIREIHQDYCRRMSELERTVMDLSKECETAYNKAVQDYINSIGA